MISGLGKSGSFCVVRSDEKRQRRGQPTGHPEIRKLIDQLGVEQFRLREDATKRLSELADVPPALRAATKSDNVDASRRAILVVSRISKRLAEKNFQAAIAELLQRIRNDRHVSS